MPVSRLARYFKSSRDKWKKKALEKPKKLRVNDQKIRDLTKSRDNWKSRAKKAEKRSKQLEKKLEKQQQKSQSSSESSPILKTTTEDLLRARGHHYTVKTIQLSVQQVMQAGNSYRAVATTMELLSQNSQTDSPHFSSIRSWLGRIGLYELNRDKEKRSDWILIIDLTLELD